jgi:para-nitrobenzyl esterase
MSTPLAKGLFQKAIIESGGPASLKIEGRQDIDETVQSKKVGRVFVELTGKKTIEELQQLSSRQVQAYSEQLADALGDSLDVTTFGQIADGNVLPLDIFKNIKNGVGSDVKVLIGTNEDEMNYFKLYDADLENSLAKEYVNGTALGRDFSKVKDVADTYIESQKSNPQKYTDFTGEFWLRQPSMIFAELQSNYNDVYMYLWTWDSKNEGLGACHAVELPFVLGNFDAVSSVDYAGENLPVELSRKVQAAWTAFATNGDPSIQGEVAWPKYDLKNRSTMIIDNKPWEVVNDPKPEGRLYLRDMYYIGE